MHAAYAVDGLFKCHFSRMDWLLTASHSVCAERAAVAQLSSADKHYCLVNRSSCWAFSRSLRSAVMTTLFFHVTENMTSPLTKTTWPWWRQQKREQLTNAPSRDVTMIHFRFRFVNRWSPVVLLVCYHVIVTLGNYYRQSSFYYALPRMSASFSSHCTQRMQCVVIALVLSVRLYHDNYSIQHGTIRYDSRV